MHKIQTPTSKVIVTDVAYSGARVFRNPRDVIQTGRDGTTPQNGNTSIRSPRLNYSVLVGGGTTASPTIMGIQDIISPKGPTSYVEVRNALIFNTSVNGNLDKNGNHTSISSKVIVQELSNYSSTNVYSHCRVKFTSNAVGTEAPDFVHLGLPAVNVGNELRSFVTPTTRVGRPMDGSNWSFLVHFLLKLQRLG